MATCTHCGAELKPGTKFCENCGAQVSAPQPPGAILCAARSQRYGAVKTRALHYYPKEGIFLRNERLF